ncbi:MAG TPA: hypothetical protein VF174_13990 [Micromonosporaceae bacterium]
MPLKWVAIVVAAVSATLCVTVNVLLMSLGNGEVPDVINMAAIATTAVAVTVAVVAHLYELTNARITALTEFLIARLNEIDQYVAEHRPDFVGGYPLGQDRDESVIPIGARGSRRTMTATED